MAIEFVVESGQGIENATSYMTIDEFKQRWDNIGYDYSSFNDNKMKQLLNKNSRLLDSIFNARYPGVRVTDSQGLEFPRYGAQYNDGFYIDDNTIPREIKDGVSELIYATAIQNVDAQPNLTVSGQVIEEEIRVDVITEKRKYAEAIDIQGVNRDTIVAVYDALGRILTQSKMGLGLPIRT